VGLLEQAGKLPGEPEAEDIFSVFPFGRYTLFDPGRIQTGQASASLLFPVFISSGRSSQGRINFF